MSRPYVSDIMSFLKDFDFFYYHKNNKEILKDIPGLVYAPVKFDADIVVDTWIGQFLYSGNVTIPFSGCNFEGLYIIMREVYRENGCTCQKSTIVNLMLIKLMIFLI